MTFQAVQRRKSLAQNAVLLSCVLVSIGVGIYYAATYPLNIGLSDCPNYLRMMAAGSSNLINASGYPAFVHLVLSTLKLLPAGDPLTDTDWLAVVQWTQTSIHSVFFITSIGLTAYLYGRLVAAAVALLWGFNLLFLGNLNSASPEWLQGHLLLLCLLVSFCARRAQRGRTKTALYLLASLILAGAYVVKFNSLLLVPVLCLLVLCERSRFWLKAVVLIACASTFAGLVFLYAATYHARSTGTRQLTFDHAWVLILALPDDYFQTDPRILGTDSLKWAVLASHVPAEYGRSHAYQHISYGAENLPKYRPIWQSIDVLPRSELEPLVRANPGSPRGRNIDLTAPFCFYYGLELTDALGIRVYREAWLTHNRYFFNRIATTLANVISAPASSQVVPSRAHPLGLQWGDIQGKFIKLTPTPGSNIYSIGYYNPTQHVRVDGVHFFDQLQSVGSYRWLYIALTCVAFLGTWFGLGRPDWREPAVMLSVLLLFVTVSSALIGLRIKEVATITPLYFVAVAVGLGNLCRQISQARWWTNVWRRLSRNS